jgi:hypothetical protein
MVPQARGPTEPEMLPEASAAGAATKATAIGS